MEQPLIIPESTKRKILIDPDKLLFDVVPLNFYETKFSAILKRKLKEELKAQNEQLHIIKDSVFSQKWVVVLRKGAILFL